MIELCTKPHGDAYTIIFFRCDYTILAKPILHSAFLACVCYENAKDFVLRTLQVTCDDAILRKYFHNH